MVVKSLLLLLVSLPFAQGGPNVAPSEITGVSTGPTTILVQWINVPTANTNFSILSYTVTYKALPDGSPQTRVVTAPRTNTTLAGLNQYTNYSITVFSSTANEAGNASEPIFVATDEDKPGAPPDDVQGQFTSSTEISVTWDIVPENLQNGEITHYIVTYQMIGGDQKTKRVNAPTRNVKLLGLAKYTFYSISVVAFTVKGGGPESIPIKVRTDEDRPAAPPTISIVTVLNSTSVFMKWEAVPLGFQNGIITYYTIYFRDVDNKEISAKIVQAPATNTTINGLRQKAEYSFWILASTIKGNGQPSGEKKATTEAIPLLEPPLDEAIGKTEVGVPFVNKKTICGGKPVSYFQIIVVPLKEGEDPGYPADPKYKNIKLTYKTKEEGKPYIAAEFPVGDGKCYSRETAGVKCLNGKLDDNTEYAVFQRSFDEDGCYEDEGFITFKTKKDNTTKLTAVVVVVVVVLAVVVVVVGCIVKGKVGVCKKEEMPVNSKSHGRRQAQGFSADQQLTINPNTTCSSAKAIKTPTGLKNS